jgi:hypothetical protein
MVLPGFWRGAGGVCWGLPADLHHGDPRHHH